MRAEPVRDARDKQDSRVKRKFLSGLLCGGLSPSFSCWRTRGRGEAREERTPAASVRFQDNYLHQIESRLEFHGGKQKNPPLARMLTSQQEKESERVRAAGGGGGGF